MLDAWQNGKAVDAVSIDQRPGWAIDEPGRDGALDAFGDGQPFVDCVLGIDLDGRSELAPREDSARPEFPSPELLPAKGIVLSRFYRQYRRGAAVWPAYVRASLLAAGYPIRVAR